MSAPSFWKRSPEELLSARAKKALLLVMVPLIAFLLLMFENSNLTPFVYMGF